MKVRLSFANVIIILFLLIGNAMFSQTDSTRIKAINERKLEVERLLKELKNLNSDFGCAMPKHPVFNNDTTGTYRYFPKPHQLNCPLDCDSVSKFIPNGVQFYSSFDSICETVDFGKVLSILILPENKFGVLIKHQNNFYSVYANLKEVFVKKDEAVFVGQEIGKTFQSREFPLIFEYRILATVINPLPYLQCSPGKKEYKYWFHLSEKEKMEVLNDPKVGDGPRKLFLHRDSMYTYMDSLCFIQAIDSIRNFNHENGEIFYLELLDTLTSCEGILREVIGVDWVEFAFKHPNYTFNYLQKLACDCISFSETQLFAEGLLLMQDRYVLGDSSGYFAIDYIHFKEHIQYELRNESPEVAEFAKCVLEETKKSLEEWHYDNRERILKDDFYVKISIPQLSGMAYVPYLNYTLSNRKLYLTNGSLTDSKFDTLKVYDISENIWQDLKDRLNYQDSLEIVQALGCMPQFGESRFWLTIKIGNKTDSQFIANCYRENYFQFIDLLNEVIPGEKKMEYNKEELLKHEKKCLKAFKKMKKK